MSLGGSQQDDAPNTSHLNFGTASDFIMRTLIMDFREHSKKKLDDILKFGVVRFIDIHTIRLHPRLEELESPFNLIHGYSTNIFNIICEQNWIGW